VYEVQATAIGGRDGSVATSDGRHRFLLAPPEIDGSGSGASPEQLLAAGYASCFLSALQSVAQDRDIRLPMDSNVTVKVGLRQSDPDGAELDLDVSLAVDLPQVSQDRIGEMVSEAHARCPFSRALAAPTSVRTIVE